MIVTDKRVVEFVEKKIGRRIYPPYTSMGWERNGEVVAGCIFNCWEPGEDIELTVAAERGAITRGYLRAMGRYVRDQLGGEVEGRREIAPGKYKYLLGITKDNWKF